MFKSLVCFAFGKGIHSKCLPFALGLAQVFHDRYIVASVGIAYTWIVPGFPANTEIYEVQERE